MQGLYFINGGNERIDLTGSFYGITNWEGLANTSMEIQTQKVPFYDGSVFLDSLLEDREITLTVVLKETDLRNRYELKNNLIRKLNPKMGEGYLYYENDYLSRRIKAIPQIPLFENKNSNDSGSQKATVVFTCCNPYWEDIKETSVTFSMGTCPRVENKGDIPAQVKVDFFTSSVKNPTLYNMTTGKRIGCKGEFTESICIDTNQGQKSVMSEKLKFYTRQLISDIHSVIYAKKYSCFFSVGDKFISYSYDGIEWNFIYTEHNLYGITYVESLNLFVAVGDSGAIITSNDGISWEERDSTVEADLRSVTYSESLKCLVIVGFDGVILTSIDGTTWELQNSPTTKDFMKVVYSESLNIFVAVGEKYGIYTSTDGINWIKVQGSQDNGYFNDICIGIRGGRIVIVGDLGKYCYTDNGVEWITQTLSGNENLNGITYAEELGYFFAVGENGHIYRSLAGSQWETLTVPFFIRLLCITYAPEIGLFSALGDSLLIMTSANGVDWTKHSEGRWKNLIAVTYSKDLNLFVAVGDSGAIITSNDGISWVDRSIFFFNFSGIIYSTKLKKFMAIGMSYFYTSTDGISWEPQPIGINCALCSMTYSEELNLFVAVGYSGIVITSSDGVNWTERTSGTGTVLTKIIYAEKLNLFVAVGWGGVALTSTDGINWELHDTGIWNLYSVTYSASLNLFVAVGQHETVYMSNDGISWTESARLGGNRNFSGVTYSDELNLFVAVGYELLYKSIDGINWIQADSDIPNILKDIIYVPSHSAFVAVGNQQVVSKSQFENISNEIQRLSDDSDINFTLQQGVNQLRLRYSDGKTIARVSFRNKYLGV